MENKEFAFKGAVANGFLMLFVNLAVAILSVVGIVYSIILLDGSDGARGGWLLGGSLLLLLVITFRITLIRRIMRQTSNLLS